MGQSTPINRDMVFTDASLTVAAARHVGTALIPEREAKRILEAHPESGVSESELIEWITERIDTVDSILSAVGTGWTADGKDGDGPRDLPRDGSDGE
jgi:hypothetical protein